VTFELFTSTLLRELCVITYLTYIQLPCCTTVWCL